MLVSKRIRYLLFFIGCVGVMLVEHPAYNGVTVAACFTWLATVFCLLFLFYLLLIANTRLLIPGFLDRQLFGFYAAGLFGSTWLYASFTQHYNGFLHNTIFHDEIVHTRGGFWDHYIYGLCCTVIVSMMYLTKKWADQEDQMKNSKINQLQTELKYLRSQINPHFLFNGLNTVYGHIHPDNSQARDMMVQFSDLLRYNLYEADVDFISVQKEIKYLRNYVDLEKARSNDNVKVSLTIEIENGDARIAPLIFMAFVENAFKHASRGDNMENEIIIDVVEKDNRISFNCKNTFEESDNGKGGIGLTNAVRRLDLLYKDKYKLDIDKSNQIYNVHLDLIL